MTILVVILGMVVGLAWFLPDGDRKDNDQSTTHQEEQLISE
ncbi:MAG TPA: hypothetical protein VFD70_12685 [Anaerolineae bacterium]|nr:hypothetical protein [Anaerolineae bacterium]